MFDLNTVLQKAQTSGFYRWLLNWSLNKMIPFNKPHDIQVVESGEYHIKTRLPYKRKNFNHIRGLHACALATLSEFTTGFLLVSKLDGKKYRLIMQRLEMDYHYQGKLDATASFSATPEWLQEKVYDPLKTQDSILLVCEVKIHDAKGNHLTTGNVYWQIKDWQKVKTKVSS
ncbi:DUF4442 domain-containing protein [Pseudochryseolinea flava]|uniref:DUF4442 domain-containing protein n=1 Tax=Pseudochryseolinea flava TaxID=2059302 RepID=A0A364XXT1_9BACT|nr:DUF4442 domain-containing protein [Pseudochryseolinea flava]RAV99091.1 DUF4442 domain-containing protein [Pseudochryseolinea flava]